jgi:trigger factor
MEKIKEKAIIKYPSQVLDHELEHVMEDLKTRLADQGLDMVAYLKSREMDEEKFIAEEAKPIAEKRLERSLILDELAKIEKIEVSKEMLQSSFEQTWGEYQGDAGFQKSMKGKSQPPKQVMNAVAMESANRAYAQQTLNRLKDIATGNAPEIPEEEPNKPVAERPSKETTPKSKKNDSVNKPRTVKSTSTEISGKPKKPVESSKKSAAASPSQKKKSSPKEKISVP